MRIIVALLPGLFSYAAASPPTPPPPPPPLVVVAGPPAGAVTIPQAMLEKLRRHGSVAVEPVPMLRLAMQRAGSRKVSTDLKVCISGSGAGFVEYTQTVKRSGYDAYDRQVRAEAANWVFDSHTRNGRPVPVCSTVTVNYRVPRPVKPDPSLLPTALRAATKEQLAALRADVEMICGAAEATGERWFNAIGPYIAERTKTDLMLDLFAKIRDGTTLDMVVERVYLAMDKIGVKRCRTIDVLVTAWAESKAP